MDFLLASHRAGRIWGIEVRLAYSLYVVVALFFFQYLPGGWFNAVPILFLPLFVLLHELAHARAARFFGVPVYDITLHALGGAAQLGGRIPGALAELLIAMAGPAMSFFLAGAGFAVAYGGGYLGVFTDRSPLALMAVEAFCYFSAWQNLILGLFNLLPVFPLDGGRIVLALAILWRGVDWGLKVIRPISRIGAIGFMLWGGYQMLGGDSGGVFMVMIGMMLFFQGGQEISARRYAEQYAYPEYGADFRPAGNGVGTVFSWLDRLISARRKNAWGNFDRPADTADGNSANAGYYNDACRDATAPEKSFWQRWREKREAARQEKNAAQAEAARRENAELQSRIDDVLGKVKRDGIASLSPGEKALLLRASEKLRDKSE